MTRDERRAELLHINWMRRLQLMGITSAIARWGDEELMVPWDALSERAKNWNIDGIRNSDATAELVDDPKEC